MQPDRRFTTLQAAAVTGVPKATINFFAQIGLVTPGGRVGSGRGRGHLWCRADLVALRLLKLAHSPTANTAQLRALARYWSTDAGRALVDEWPKVGSGGTLLVTDTGETFFNEPTETVLSTEDVQFVLAVKLDAVFDQLLIAETEWQILLGPPPSLETGRVPLGPRRKANSHVAKGERRNRGRSKKKGGRQR